MIVTLTSGTVINLGNIKGVDGKDGKDGISITGAEINANGEWEATGIEDVKTYKYSIGPSEKDNQEVVRPNMIVSIIFALFGYLIDLIAGGSLF